MPEVAGTIPFTAWQQIAVVCLFAVVFCGIIAFLMNWFTKQQASWQRSVKEQSEQWQKFIKEQNDQWQRWLAEQNTRECDAMAKVTISLDKLTEKLAEHDDKVEDRFNKAVETITRPPRRKI
jgi:hypothetical protein